MINIFIIAVITGISIVYLGRHIWQQATGTGSHKCDSCSLNCCVADTDGELFRKH